jgi:hypothetical protein
MVIQLSQVSPEPVKWIWTDRVARGMITILEGHPGEGKSLLSLAIAASVSAGRPCPGDGIYSSPGRVLLVCPEDDLATTVLPRLRAFDANPDNILAPHADEMERTLKDPALLATIIKKARPDLVIIDPVKAIISNSGDYMVRMALECWRQAALKVNAGIVLVRHLTKSAAGHIGLQGCGSIAYQAVARFVFRIEAHPFESDQRLVVPIKSNLGKLPPMAVFRLLGGDSLAGLDWVNAAHHGLARRHRGACPRLTEAIRFVIAELMNGPVRTKTFQKRAKDAFIATKTLRDAMEMIGVAHRKVGGRCNSFWIVELPIGLTIDGLIRSVRDEDIDHLVQDLIHGNACLDEMGAREGLSRSDPSPPNFEDAPN